MRSIFLTLHRVFHDPTYAWYRRVDFVVWVLIVFSVLLTGIEVFGGGIGRSWAPWLGPVESVVLAIFVVEISLRVATWVPRDLGMFVLNPAQRLRHEIGGRVRFMLEPMQLIDLMAVLPIVDPAFRGLRALRLLRLLRSFRVFRFRNPFEQISGAFLDNKLLYYFAFAFLGVETLLGGLVIYQMEKGSGAIDTPLKGMWWTIVTLTTVGYGDLTPVTAAGRVWASALMVLGMFTLALFAGIVGHTMLNTVLTIREEQFRMATYTKHIVVCGYDEGSRLLLDALTEELGDDSVTDVLLMGKGERPPDVPTAFRWVQGDPTKELEFDKVRLTHAAVVVVVGGRGDSAQEADARTILTVFTVRSYMRKQAESMRRAVPVHVVAEVLDTENIEHARVAGADEVIASARIGFSLLAHTVVQPGTAGIMSRVVSKGHQSVFVGSASEYVGKSVAEARAALKTEFDVLLIGLREAGAVREKLNVPDETEILASHALIYLGPAAVLPDPDAPWVGGA